MTIVEYEGKKYDTGFEFDTVRHSANSILCRCAKLADLSTTNDGEKAELFEIRREMAQLKQKFEMVNNLPLILQMQEQLRDLNADLDQKYGNRSN
ncbi:MAG: hypothetical protein IKZ87_09240 [Actinomycetaceae bacterium]|nr:hypothetical protein [Actinomycetaceae bacterium]